MEDNTIIKERTNKKPDDFILNPALSNFVLLDQISRRTRESLEAQTEIVRLLQSNQITLNSILKEIKDEADEGLFMESHGIVGTTNFVVVNVEVILDQRVKGYYIKNDGPNDILISHNLTPDGATVESATLDRTGVNLTTVKTGEIESFVYNRNKVRNIYLLAVNGESNYRLKLVW